jgi:hypothetical protein
VIDHQADTESGAVLFFRSLRLLRSCHYIGMVLAGGCFACLDFSQPLSGQIRSWISNPSDLIGFLAAGISIFFAFQTLNLWNHFTDLRSGVQKKEFTAGYALAGPAQWRRLGWIYGVLSFASVLTFCGPHVVLMVGLYFIIGALYIMPPFRWKRWYPLSTFLLALAALAACGAGFLAIPGHHAPGKFPAAFAWVVLVTFTLSFGTKDRKDIERDRQAGFRTLYTMFPPKQAKATNAVIVLFSFLAVPYIIGIPGLLVVAAPFGIVTAAVIQLTAETRERLIFSFYFLFWMAILAFFALKGLIRW